LLTSPSSLELILKDSLNSLAFIILARTRLVPPSELAPFAFPSSVLSLNPSNCPLLLLANEDSSSLLLSDKFAVPPPPPGGPGLLATPWLPAF
jgi:hypothetical protein